MRPSLTLVCLALVSSACTPLLGGDIACNDDGDCPPERRNCRAQLCRDESIPRPSEGEGEGEESPLAASLHVTTPMPSFPAEDVVLALEALDAERCDLDFDLIARTPRALTQEELATGEVRVSFTDQEVEALLVETLDEGHLVARVRCARGADEVVAVAALQLTRGVRVTLDLDTTVLPLAGGAVEACWSAPADSTCNLRFNWSEIVLEGAGPIGCATVDVPAVEVDTYSWVQAECTGTFGTVSGESNVVQGTGVGRFDVQPRVLAGPGEVRVRWEAIGASCTLTRVDPETGLTLEDRAADLSGDLVLDADEDVWLGLWCTNPDGGGGIMTGSAYVPVGPSLRLFEVASVNRGEYEVTYSSRLTRTCSVVLSSGDREDGLPVAPRKLDYERFLFSPTPTLATDVTVACDGFAGAVREAVSFAEIDPPRILDAHFVLDGTLDAYRTVEMCWHSEDAARCFVYRDDDADEVPTSGCRDEEIEESLYRQLFCLDEHGWSIDSHWFELSPWPTGALSAWPRALQAPGPVQFSWTSQAASSCALVDEDGTEHAAGTDGTATLTVSANTRFDLICQSAEGPVTDSAAILVGPQITQLQTSIANDQVDVPAYVLVGWRAENVERCALTAENDGGDVELDNVAVRNGAWSGGRPQLSSNAIMLPLALVGAGDTTVTLACDDGAGGLVEQSVVIGEPAQAVITSLEVTPGALPAEGGAVDVCWSATGAEQCSWLLTDELGSYLSDGVGPAEGCWSTVGEPVVLSETTRVFFQCSGVLGIDDRALVIPVGPYLEELTSSPRHLTEPGNAIVSWSTVNVDSCVLRDGDGIEVATGGAEGAVALAFDESRRFVLDCDDGALTEELFVAVGAAIVRFDVEFEESTEAWRWSLESALLADCDVRISGEREYGMLIETGACADGCSDVTWWDFNFYGAMTARARCMDADGTVVEESVTIDPRGPTLSLTLSADALPIAGGDVEVCWSAADAESCLLNGAPVTASGCETHSYVVEGVEELQCSSPAGTRWLRKPVLVGPGIRSFAFDESIVFTDESQVAHLSWDAVGVESCVLTGELVGMIDLEPAGTREIILPELGPGTFVHSLSLWCSDADGPPPDALGDVARHINLYAGE
jgi:hypothetical protein